MSDLSDEFLQPQSDEAAADLRQRRRQIVDRFVSSLREILTISASSAPQSSPLPIVGLIGEIQAMIERLADAEDTTFAEVVQDAMSLLQSLEDHGRDLAAQVVASRSGDIVDWRIPPVGDEKRTDRHAGPRHACPVND